MQTDSAGETLRLAEEYRARSDEELRELAEGFADLTEPAQQALRQEMLSRKLGDPGAAGGEAASSIAGARVSNAPNMRGTNPRTPLDSVSQQAASPIGIFESPAEIVPDEPEGQGEGDTSGPQDYTWKTVLCDCDTTDEAQYLVAALRNSGLDGWVQASREFGRRYARVLVAADQLEQAKAVAAQPIPQEIIDESKKEIPEFIEPKCPKCGADDPTLESVEPENHWHCEECGHDWSDSAEIAGDSPAPPDNLPLKTERAARQ